MKESSGLPQVVRFGAFEFDPRSGELRKAGLKLHLQGQPVEILATLLAHPGQVVTREELQKKLWPADTFVDFEHSLNAAIKRLREVLGDDADNPRFVETIPRRGYRFIAAAEVSSRVAARRPARTQLVLGAVAVVVLVAVLVGLNVRGRRMRLLAHSPTRINSLAVLPLENLSRDPEQEYFADGLTDELIAQLAQIGALRVISRTSVMRYKGTKKPLAEIARELNVDAVVEGSVLRSGDRVRITAQLIEAPSDTHLFARSYERDVRDVLALQNEVARAIASEIRVKLTPQEQRRLASARPINPEAHELYLKGRYEWYKRTPDSLKKSIQYFEQAIEKDPGYALAYAGLADAYGIASTYHVLPPRDSDPRAKAAAMKALEIDDTLAEAHAALGHVKTGYDGPGAEREFKRAIELNPSYANAHFFYAISYLEPLGRLQEAIAELQKAHELDPLALIITTNLGRAFYYARQYDRAVEQCRKALELDPSYGPALCRMVYVYEQEGMYQQALADIENYSPQTSCPGLNGVELRRAYVASGAKGYWQKRLELEKEMAKHAAYYRPSRMAEIFVRMGEKDQAFVWLEKAYEDRDGWLGYLKIEPAFDPLRSDPRFTGLVRRMRLPP